MFPLLLGSSGVSPHIERRFRRRKPTILAGMLCLLQVQYAIVIANSNLIQYHLSYSLESQWEKENLGLYNNINETKASLIMDKQLSSTEEVPSLRGWFLKVCRSPYNFHAVLIRLRLSLFLFLFSTKGKARCCQASLFRA